MNEASAPAHHLRSLQVMRAIAVWLVVFMHCMYQSAFYLREVVTAVWTTFGAHIGHAGVDIFFVISGLVMFLIAHRDASADTIRPGSSVRFLIRRAARIYPLFWLTLFLFALLPSQPWRKGDVHWLLDHPFLLVLLEGPGPMHPVAWTLVYEVGFYLAVAVCMLFGARYLRLAFLVLCIAQTILVLLATFGFLPQVMLFSPITLEFGFGIALGWVLLSRRQAPPFIVLVAGIAALLTAMVLIPPEANYGPSFVRVLGFGAPAAAILYGLVILERRGKFKAHRVLVVSGDISYSLYLWHLPVLIAVGEGARAMGLFALKSWPVALAYVLLSATITVLLSLASFRWVEAPLMRWASVRTRAPTSRPADGLVVGGAPAG